MLELKAIDVLDHLDAYASALGASHVLLATALVVLAVALIRTPWGGSLLIAAFVVSICYATAADLRADIPFLGVLPGVLAAVILGYVVLVRWRRLHRLVLAGAWLLLILAFTLRAIFSEVGSPSLYWNLYYLLVLSLGLALGALMTVSSLRTSVARGLMLGSLSVLLIALVAVLLQSELRAFTQNRLTPFGVQANIWGPSSVVAVLNISLYLALPRSGGSRWWLATALLVAVTSVLLSFSRGSLVGLVAGGCVYLIVASGHRLKTALFMLTLLVSLWGLVRWAGSSGLLELEAAERLGSLRSESRESLMIDLYEQYVAREPLFGHGFFQKEGSLEVGRGDPHSSFLLVWIEQGTIGLLIVMLMLTITCRSILLATQRFPARSFEHVLALHTVFALVTVIVMGLSVPHLWTHHTVLGFDFALRVGIVAGLGARRLPALRRSARPLMQSVGLTTRSHSRVRRSSRVAGARCVGVVSAPRQTANGMGS